MVSVLTQGTTTKVRNQIAGYITRTFAGMPTVSSSTETAEESEESQEAEVE
jgi:ribosomal protein S17E